MPDSFRLLRDNKESGPFTRDELLQLSLKPFDLVWVEGKCTGWRYPAEIELLKPNLVGVKAEKERVFVQPPRTSSSYNREVNNRAPSDPLESDQTETLTVEREEEEITAENLEKKATEIYLRVQAYTKQKELGNEIEQTNYGRSLDELKQEYADWLYHKNHKSRFGASKNYILPGIVILLLASGSYFIIGRTNSIRELPAGENYVLSNTREKPGTYKKTKNNPATVAAKAFTPVKKSRKELSVDEFIDSVRREISKQDKRLRMAAIKSQYKKSVTPEVRQ